MIEFLLTAASNVVLWAFGLIVFGAVLLGFALMIDDGWKTFLRYLRLRALRKQRTERLHHNPQFEHMAAYSQADADMTMRMYDALPHHTNIRKSQDEADRAIFKTIEEFGK